jgi:two-component sensor histidine kinase
LFQWRPAPELLNGRNSGQGIFHVRSIRLYLFALVAICLILATTAFGLVVAQTNAVNRQRAEAQARETAKALSFAVDGKIGRAMGVLRALSVSNAAATRNWTLLDRQARIALEDRDAWIVIHDRSGRQFVNTLLPAGSQLPKAPPPAEMWKALARSKSHICDLTRGAVEPNIVCVDVPLGTAANPQYAISAIFRPRSFDAIVKRENARTGNIATLVDRSGRVIWRNIKPEEFVGHRATGRMLDALSRSDSEVLQTTSLEGVAMLSAFNRSSLSGWSVIVGSPIDQVETGTRQAVWRGSLLALAILLTGAALAALIGAKLVRSVQALVEASKLDGAGKSAKRTGIREIDAVGDALRGSFAARAESERHQQTLIGELNHRVKNTLAVVQSLAHQTFGGNASPQAAIAAFDARLGALASAHNLLTEQRWEAASMMQIVVAAMRPFCQPNRCHFEGPDFKVAPQTAVTLALALHELATNASKYGSLSSDEGAIDVSWTEHDGQFDLFWRESGGPRVREPKTAGFGTRLIKRGLAADLHGSVDLDFKPDGLVCRISGQIRTITPTKLPN